jgi:uncharacterized paraquat-inducible protein A
MRFGFGRGRRDGRRGRGFGAGMPPTSCICPRCGMIIPHQPAFPCFKLKCPRCGTFMTRKFPDEK